MKRKFGAMALALSMGLSLTNGVLAEEQPFDVVGESSPRTFENKDVTIINDNVTDPDKEDDGDEKDTDQTDTSFDFDKDIEDENLKNYLTAMFPKDIDWKTVNYLRISTDNAGENYQELNEFAQKIKNLNGLDKLPNLETLQCYQLTGLKGKTTLKNSSTLSVINIGNCGESTSNTAPESGLDSSPESNTDFSLELSDLPGLEFLTVISNPGLNSLSITGNT